MDPQIENLHAAHEALLFAVENYPERLEVVALEDLVTDSARQNARRSAYVKLAVPDEVVKSLRGPAERRTDMLVLVSIPKDVQERSKSLIVLPGEV